jgi:hypothetical protein
MWDRLYQRHHDLRLLSQRGAEAQLRVCVVSER